MEYQIVTFFKQNGTNGYLSNHFPCEIDVNGYRFPTSEHYYMARKALLFNDLECFGLIMGTKKPRKAKSLSRKIKGFDSDKWDGERYSVMLDSLTLKFAQNLELKERLLGTGDALLVECSPYDQIWGVGMEEAEFLSLGRSEMAKVLENRNILGRALMLVRESLRNL